MKNLHLIDTIVAQATPSGRGGVGIVRISGPLVKTIAQTILPTMPAARMAQFGDFLDADGSVIDQGIALYFVAPHSFTGEDVLELQGHGGPIVLDRLIQRAIHLGARLARPGEFSERAFLNDKLDLTQAEAIADLIDAQSEQAARCAIRSLQGEFSKHIDQLLSSVISLRMYVEAAIDFPEEEVDFLSEGQVGQRLQQVLDEVSQVLISAQQGAILRDGMTVVIAGKPNAGKSSLLNALSGHDAAIVTDIPGTTRDTLREHIQIDGMPLHIIDTAGLRDSDDIVEQHGIQRAWQALEKADAVLLVIDSSLHTTADLAAQYPQLFALNKPLLVIENKADLTKHKIEQQHSDGYTRIFMSAKTGTGLELLKQALKDIVGFHSHAESNFIARRRHLDALHRTQRALTTAQQQLIQFNAGELVAEELHQAQQALGEITGKFTSDDLLGEIFSSFCIGK